MNLLLESDLEPLLAERPGPCISLYFPISGSGAEMRQIRSRLKRLLDLSRAGLSARGHDESPTAALLGPLEDLLASLLFWSTRDDGIAVFRAPGFIRTFHLPHAVAERCAVDDHFFLEPLFAPASRDLPEEWSDELAGLFSHGHAVPHGHVANADVSWIG